MKTRPRSRRWDSPRRLELPERAGGLGRRIEIAVGGGVGCSNFCAKMAPTVGEVPTVYVPIACTSRGGDDERE